MTNLPKKLSKPDLRDRIRLAERRDKLQETAIALEEAKVELDGAWEFWRDGISKKYSLGERDEVADDGKIKRTD